MVFYSKILGYRDFGNEQKIAHQIASKYNEDDLHLLALMIFFKTQRQQTWLVASKNNLYCVLDDIKKEDLEVRWRMPYRELIEDGRIILDIKVYPEYKEKSGRIDFGSNHRGWLYSKNLFLDTPQLKLQIENFIMSNMNR